MVDKLKSLVKEKLENQNFKATKADAAAIRKNAKKYTGGNVSAWIRYASIHYKPKDSELVKE